MIFCLVYAMLGLAAAWFYSRFPFGRDEHDAHLQALTDAGEADIDRSGSIARPTTKDIPIA